MNNIPHSAQKMPMTEFLLACADAVRQAVATALSENSAETHSQAMRHSGSDVIYHIDEAIEPALVNCVEEWAERLGGVVLIAEGIGEDEKTILPQGTKEEDAAWRVLADPIDGTRMLMMEKRSAFFLAGAAPNLGQDTCLKDIQYAIMAELPTSRARLADTFYAERGCGASGTQLDLVTGLSTPIQASPSTATTLRGGFGQISRFFPSGKDILARIEEDMLAQLYPDASAGEILTFEDQYISSGGQLYELITGKDQFTADVRGRLYGSPKHPTLRPGHMCHPYDLAAALIAEEVGIHLTDAAGQPLNAPLDTMSPVDWIGYANTAIREEVEPTLLKVLTDHLGEAG